MITEEFTFPIITSNNVVRLTVLPALWRISSINQSDADDELEQENGRNKRKVIFRSFSEVEGEIIKKLENNSEKSAAAEAKAEAEEKMDMLWEDFNEEAASNDSAETDHHTNNYSTSDRFHFREEFEDDECNMNVHECRKRKKQLEIVGKMMKKLSWVQNRYLARIKKRGPNI